MANTKLDMGKAWTEATALIGANMNTISAVAGLFFFLPSFALALFAPELVNPPPADPVPGNDPQLALEAAVAQMQAVYADNWAIMLAVTVAQFIGSLSLLALLTDRGRPTVGEALRAGLKSMPAYLAAQILTVIAASLALGVPLGIVAAVAPSAVVVLVGFLLVLGGAYIVIKFSLIAPVIAIEQERNPIAALKRSWKLTKGNSFRLVAFLLLLFLTIGIISLLVSGVIGLVLAAFNPTVVTIGNGILNGLVNSVIAVVFLVVFAAIHQQLAGPSAERVAQTFE